MTEGGDMPSEPPEARRRSARGPGWDWLIPLAALGVAAWLAYAEWLGGAEEVTVRFAEAEGVSVGAPVRYRGAPVGRVEAIRVADDLEGVALEVALEGPVAGRLGEETKFWIRRPRLARGELRGLISGAHLAVRPGDGPPARSFEGLEEPPPPAVAGDGRRFVLRTGDAGGLSEGAPVLFRGLEVGQVVETRLAESARRVEVVVLVDADRAELVREGSAFWQAGGISFSMADGPDLDLPPLPALGSGAVAFGTPELFAGPPAESGAVFALHEDRDNAEAAMTGPRFAYLIGFPEVVGGLSQGAPMTLEGRQIGRVAHVTLALEAERGRLGTGVRIRIDALALGLDAEEAGSREEMRQRLDARVAALVKNGLRATVTSGGVLSGGKSVELVMVGGAGEARLDRGHDPPAIPPAPPESD